MVRDLIWALNKIVAGEMRAKRTRGFQHIKSRRITCGSEHAFKLPMGLSFQDIRRYEGALINACGAPVELVDRGGAVVIRVIERDFPSRLGFNPNDLRDDRILIGYDRLMRPVYQKLMHLLMGGASGAGKTMLLRFLLYQLIRIGAHVNIVDLKGFSFFPFEVFPNVQVAKSLPESADILYAAAAELEERENRIIRSRNRSLTSTFVPHIIIIDEAAQIAPHTHTSKRMKEYAKFCDETCARISQKGRESKVILFYCTQKPEKAIVNGQVRANVETSIGFRTNDHYESQIILGTDGAERISIDTPGRCYYKSTGIQLIQSPFVGEEDADWERLLSDLKTEVVSDGHSRRTEPQRTIVEGSYTRADSDHETTSNVERFAGPAEESIQHPTRARKREISQERLPRAREGLATVSKGTKSAEYYTDEIE